VGALTFAMDPDLPIAFGNRRMVTGMMFFSNSYATGGDTFEPNDLGFELLELLIVAPSFVIGSSDKVVIPVCTRIRPITQSEAAGTVALYGVDTTPNADVGAQSALQEITAGTNVSTFCARFLAIGR